MLPAVPLPEQDIHQHLPGSSKQPCQMFSWGLPSQEDEQANRQHPHEGDVGGQTGVPGQAENEQA